MQLLRTTNQQQRTRTSRLAQSRGSFYTQQLSLHSLVRQHDAAWQALVNGRRRPLLPDLHGQQLGVAVDVGTASAQRANWALVVVAACQQEHELLHDAVAPVVAG